MRVVRNSLLPELDVATLTPSARIPKMVAANAPVVMIAYEIKDILT